MLRDIGTEFDMNLPDGAVIRYCVIAHVLVGFSEHSPTHLAEEVRCVKYTPPSYTVQADLGWTTATHEHKYPRRDGICSICGESLASRCQRKPLGR